MPRKTGLSSNESVNRALRLVRGGEQDIQSLKYKSGVSASRGLTVGDLVQSSARAAMAIMQNQPEGTWGLFSSAKLRSAMQVQMLKQVETIMTGQNAIISVMMNSIVAEYSLKAAERFNRIWRKFVLAQSPEVRAAIRTELVNYSHDLDELMKEHLPEELEHEGIIAFEESHRTAMSMLKHQIVFDQEGMMRDAREMAAEFDRSALSGRSLPTGQISASPSRPALPVTAGAGELPEDFGL